MKDIKHIRQDFYSVAWVMHQGWDFGGKIGGWGGQHFVPEIQPDLVCESLTWMSHATAQFLESQPPGVLGRDKKVKYH